MLSASANKLSKLKEQAQEYASLIMEELDPENLEYIEFSQYRNKAAFQVMGYCLTTAKGAAEILKLNMALILLPVCRNALTWLRSTRARLFVPFDDNINFHKAPSFSITSASGNDNLSVHIRIVGDWTKELKRHGLGIGATPFISILRDLLNNIKNMEDQTESSTDICRSDDSLNSFTSSSATPCGKKKSRKTTNAHFYWVTREPGSFEWFKGVMDEIE
ncbi:hypothetical protein GIB67_015672 [Kingdonia uniflora]|uniref:Ferric reductase NAD binding domain-containing protein n=1 Tax=Kingdonia uniflora TaxID=39325 RepID=A0A7J7NUI5_9MAGN|nr:hypothetical protein GIB67_015672 [Kingdonia uniflora]